MQPLTDSLITKVLVLNRLKYTPVEISDETGLTPKKIEKLLKAKYVNRKEKKLKVFDFESYPNGIV